jgi:PAS domain S-box-containing protein
MAVWTILTQIARHPVVRYGVAVMAVVSALAALRIAGPGAGLGGILFFAVMFSAWFGGLGPGVLSTALITLLGVARVATVHRTDSFDLPRAIVGLGLFTVGGILISSLLEALHSARRRAEESADLAQRRQETLRQSEARFHAILENSPAVVTMKDTAGRYLMVNRRFATLFAIEESQVVGKTDFDLFPPATAEQLAASDRRVVEGGRPIEFEELVHHQDQKRTYLSVKFPLFSADGSIMAICSKSTDITDRKHAEEHRLRLARQAALRADVSMALALNETALATILEHCVQAQVRHLEVARAGIWTLDAAGQTLVLQASAGASPDLDAAVHRIPVGSSLIGAIGRDHRPHWTSNRDDPDPIDPREPWARGGMVAFAGYPLIVEDRILGVMALAASHPFEADTLESLAGLAELIAQGIERKRLEIERIDLLARERAARAEAEEANRAKDQFLAVLSHELRTPLTPILASVSALLDEPETSPEVRSVLELTHWGIELESRLIDDLLDITRIIRGRLSLHPETTDAHFLLLRAEEICRPEIEAGRITLRRELAAVEHHVDADPARLEQVYWNLIKNAVKFSPRGGTLTIRTRNQSMPRSGSATEVAELVVEIADTGIGIEPAVLPTIFDAFTQAEAGQVRRFGGLGLGLAISRSVVEAHGGRIVATSAGKDQGATFTIHLATVPSASRGEPVPATPASMVNSQPCPSTSQRSMLKILLVEDDGPTLKVMTRLLGKAPYVVKTANTIATALEAASEADFDLIISDIGLPDGSGLELMRQIRDRYAARGIALSGYGMEEDIRKSREAGFLAHLTKPVDFQKLQVAIAQVLS